MRRIEPLPEGVRSSVRSGIILYDLTRVVEELIFNSLDAGATKVYVAVGVGTCFVKVADNGYGVDRDGLVLLGERYATSRHGGFHALESRGSFGFHGEALSSISDVSLLEITTKAAGMPHGYRKVMKGCKCLHLGINDDNREVGTTVVVRDLFYNQPVRRKRMQSRPKKVLHSVKKCVLRIALVHSTVSFRVADIESEDDLLRTGSSPSPLQLLASNFGVEANKHLHEIEVCESELTLSGYISGPFGIFSMKALQYIYINSRFVCKGPVHKLLNQLATGYVDNRKFGDAPPQHEKKSRSQIYPTFILDLSCPRSYYEIAFEPTKNLVEFRDWGSILHFIQNAVTRFWMESTSIGGCNMSSFLGKKLFFSYKKNLYRLPADRARCGLYSVSLSVLSKHSEEEDEDLLPHSEIPKKRRRTQQCLDPLSFPPLNRLKQMEDWDNLPASLENLSSYNTSDGAASEQRKLKTEALVIHDTSNVAHSCSSTVFRFEATENEQPDSSLQLSDHCPFDEDNIWKDLCIADVSCVGSSLGQRWQEEPIEDDDKMDNLFMGGTKLNNCHEFTDNAQVNGHFGRSSQFGWATRRNLPHYGPFSTSDVRFESESDDLGAPEKRFHYVAPDDSVVEDDVHQMFREISPREDKTKKDWSFSKCTSLRNLGINVKCLSPEAEQFDEGIEIKSPKYIRTCSSKSEWTRLALSPSIDTAFGDIDKLSGDEFGSLFEYGKGWNQDEAPVIRCKEHFFDEKSYDCFWGDYNMNREHGSRSSFLPTCSKVLVDSIPETLDPFWLPLSVHSNKTKCRRIGTKKQARSFSAPPFYRHRKKYSVLGSSLKISTGTTLAPATNTESHFPESINLKHDTVVETGNMRHRQALNGQCSLFSTPSYVDDSFCSGRKLESPDIGSTEPEKGISSIMGLVEGMTAKKCEDILESSWKWRNSCAESESGVKLRRTEVQDPAILDIGSGILHLSHDLLVPNCISRSNLEEARVLLQADKKFIPVVAGQTLAIIDQHAADERIRLEELRKKVLSGEMKQSTYLEAEQELVLPEIGYQLLQNYAEEIEHWGWICRIDGEGSPSFSKNLNTISRHRTTAKLVAVPCILGVNLTDVDLLEFLQQLADTDGSSTLPPAFHRILNNKACRGAIMFGDKLLPSECSLIVEELSRTSLCFQCAHGRPTAVPLLDLAMLHKQIASLGCNRGTRESWHGLHKHEISLARASHRLSPG